MFFKDDPETHLQRAVGRVLENEQKENILVYNFFVFNETELANFAISVSSENCKWASRFQASTDIEVPIF